MLVEPLGKRRSLIFRILLFPPDCKYSRSLMQNNQFQRRTWYLTPRRFFAFLISAKATPSRTIIPCYPSYWSLSYRDRIHDVSSSINRANIAEEVLRNSLTSIRSSCSIRGYLLLSALDDVLGSTPISTIMSRRRSIACYIKAIHCSSRLRIGDCLIKDYECEIVFSLVYYSLLYQK